MLLGRGARLPLREHRTQPPACRSTPPIARSNSPRRGLRQQSASSRFRPPSAGGRPFVATLQCKSKWPDRHEQAPTYPRDGHKMEDVSFQVQCSPRSNIAFLRRLTESPAPNQAIEYRIVDRSRQETASLSPHRDPRNCLTSAECDAQRFAQPKWIRDLGRSHPRASGPRTHRSLPFPNSQTDGGRLSGFRSTSIHALMRARRRVN
jgi:hypothetical protein